MDNIERLTYRYSNDASSDIYGSVAIGVMPTVSYVDYAMNPREPFHITRWIASERDRECKEMEVRVVVRVISINTALGQRMREAWAHTEFRMW